jgi:hypothetical protein
MAIVEEAAFSYKNRTTTSAMGALQRVTNDFSQQWCDIWTASIPSEAVPEDAKALRGRRNADLQLAVEAPRPPQRGV